MKCIRCGAALLMNGQCSKCGLTQEFINKCLKTSAYYYNKGLEKAQIRDLSGAIEELKKSLKYNKLNTDARNLLGLCYHEMGEVVSALSEWVVSQHFQPENNDATAYMQSIQKNPAKLDEVSATIRKYNQTLDYLRQGDFDLALIQLKRIIGMRSNFVNAQLLLALLYIKTEEKEKAKKTLRRVLKIDTNNTAALRYYRELTGSNAGNRYMQSSRTVESEPEKRAVSEHATDTANEKKRKIKHPDIAPSNRLSIDQYVESSNNKYTFIGIIVGLLIGVAAMWLLIIPQKTSSLAESYNSMKKEYNEEISSKNKEISSLKDDATSVKKEKEQLQQELSKALGNSKDGNVYENLMYAAKYYNNSDNQKAAEYLAKINDKDLELKSSKTLYSQLTEKVYPAVAAAAYNKGYSEFNSGDFANAVKDLELAYKYNDTNVDALYYWGRSYQHSNHYDKAKKIYEKVIDNFPDTRRAMQAEQNIKAMGN